METMKFRQHELEMFPLLLAFAMDYLRGEQSVPSLGLDALW
jgi:hypothetical protein